jgi:GntR family transcriptional regulator
LLLALLNALVFDLGQLDQPAKQIGDAELDLLVEKWTHFAGASLPVHRAVLLHRHFQTPPDLRPDPHPDRSGPAPAQGRTQSAIRTLAKELGINPNTVARAYLDLQHAGLVEMRHGSGTYVAQLLPRLTKRECLKRITEHVDALLAEARLLGVSTGDVIELIQERSRATR